MRVIAITPSSSGLNEHLAAAEWKLLIEHAVARWNSALTECCAVKFSVSQVADRWLATEDGINLVVLRHGDWCHNDRCGTKTTFPSGALGMTTVYPEGALGKTVREADVEVNATKLQVSSSSLTQTDTAPMLLVQGRDAVPLETILVHELGHVLGLGDSCNIGHRVSGRPILGSCDDEQRDRVMFAPARRLTPAKADVDEVQWLYPRSEPIPPAVTQSGLATALPCIGIALIVGCLIWLMGRRRRAR